MKLLGKGRGANETRGGGGGRERERERERERGEKKGNNVQSRRIRRKKGVRTGGKKDCRERSEQP